MSTMDLRHIHSIPLMGFEAIASMVWYTLFVDVLGYRLDHSPLLILMKQGSEGHTLHGGECEACEP